MNLKFDWDLMGAAKGVEQNDEAVKLGWS